MVPSPWQRRGRDLRLTAPGRRQRHNDPHQMSRASTEGGGGGEGVETERVTNIQWCSY